MCITLCLKRTFRVLRDKLGRQYGWKVFRLLDGGEYVGEFCGKATIRPKGKWLKAKKFTPKNRADMSSAMSISGYYKSGWHVFIRKCDAESWSNGYRKRVVKVLVRGVREKGYASGLDCFIADGMFIPVGG